MKKIIIALLFIMSLVSGCKCQDYIAFIPTTQGVYTVKFGLLYNWYVTQDARNIANSGWHVPIQSEYNTFLAYCGGSTVAGGVLKETGTTYWATPNDATNTMLFNSRGGGRRLDATGAFQENKQYGRYWLNWTSSGRGVMFIHINNATTMSSGSVISKTGASLRLMKDSTTLTHGQSGTYTGNDGKVYRTICIGTQEWIADNLAETKYRNGDWVHGFDGGTYTPISNTDWAALTTEGCCVYNDDLNNR